MQVIRVRAKQIFTKTSIPGADWAINQYVGCQHSCLYCYAKFVCRWKSYGPWGTWVEVKENAPELARRYHPGLVLMSTISDPYQPVERELGITRKILENLDPRTELSILTKSDLVTRDVGVLSRLSRAEVGFTIGGLPNELERKWEPFAPPSTRRLKALKELHDAGIPTYVFVSPILPGVNDVDGVVRKAKAYSEGFWFEFLNLRASGSGFASLVRRDFLEAYQALKSPEVMKGEVSRIRELASSEGVKVEGIVIHDKRMRMKVLSGS